MGFNSQTAKLAGQKSKRGVGIRAAVLDSFFTEQKAKAIFSKLEDIALKGDMSAINTYLAYCFGKPEGKLDITSDGEQIGMDLTKLSTGQLSQLREIKESLKVA